MPTEAEILAYYAARANEYEKVYAKPERQNDLRFLHQVVPTYLTRHRVLEVACGTGYWTRMIAARATSVTGIDLSLEVLAVARAEQPASAPAQFVLGDAYALDRVPGKFDAAFLGFWWSHVQHAKLHRFLTGLHRRLEPNSLVLVLDNRYVAGSNWPITRADEQGNTYQRRQLDDGAEYEVVKNFPSTADVSDAIEAAGGTHIAVHELQYYWYVAYKVGVAG